MTPKLQLLTTDQTDSVILVDSSSTADSSAIDELTTDELISAIEYNTRMTSQGIGHIFILGIVLLGGFATWIVIKKWYFGGV